jgi:RND family efflux transporter MFP subunit
MDRVKTMTRTYRAVSIALIIFSALAAGCGSEKENAPAPPSAPVVKVTREDLSNTLEIASEFQPYQEIDVDAKVSGYIQKLYIDWGSHVRNGQVLADLEIPELEQQLQQDEATLHRSESDLEKARDDLDQANSAYNIAHITFTRLQGVQKTQPGLISQQDIDVAQSKDQETGAGVSGAKHALAAAQQASDEARANLDKDKALYAYSHIIAPFDGVVTKMYAFTGALLPAGTSSNIGTSALCRLSQNNVLRLVIPVPERAVPEIHFGESIAVSVSALGKTFTGKIARIAGQIDMETRTMHTEVEVSNPNYELVPGMYASVKIPLQDAKAVLVAPIQAVQIGSGGKGTVLLVNDRNTIESREVALGLQSATEMEIVSGLKENDTIVFGELGQYRAGEVISPKPIQPGLQQQ